jgi:hypothetical protein
MKSGSERVERRWQRTGQVDKGNRWAIEEPFKNTRRENRIKIVGRPVTEIMGGAAEKSLGPPQAHARQAALDETRE